MRLGLLALVAMLMGARPVAAQDGALIAIAATPSGDGVLTVPAGGVAAFAFAVMNFGATAITVTVDAVEEPDLEPDVSIALVCFTDPATGQCLSSDTSSILSPGETVTMSFGQVATGTVFVQAEPDTFPFFNPALARIVVFFSAVDFSNPHFPRSGADYAATSVALRVR